MATTGTLTTATNGAPSVETVERALWAATSDPSDIEISAVARRLHAALLADAATRDELTDDGCSTLDTTSTGSAWGAEDVERALLAATEDPDDFAVPAVARRVHEALTSCADPG